MRLTGYLSRIDGKKLVFEFLDNYDEGRDETGKLSTSRERLERYFGDSPHVPFDSRTFHVFVADVTDDIRNMTGRQVSITVYTRKYSFVSRSSHNRGEKIQGEKLMLDTIDVITQV